MKSVATLIIALFCSLSVFAADHETKTFLVLFQSKELKSLKVSVKDIESQFSSVFKTKSYQGNSVPSILIEIPNCDFDACFLGDILIELENGKKIKLQELAFRVIDIGEEKKSYESELITFESQPKKSLKAEKPEKANPKP
jgi:hypothetical protein